MFGKQRWIFPMVGTFRVFGVFCGEKSSNAWKVELVERDFQARSSVRGAPASPFWKPKA